MSDKSRSGDVSERGRGNASVERSVSPEAASAALHVVDYGLSELYVRAQEIINAEQQPVHAVAAEIAARVGSAVPLADLQAQQPQAAEKTEQQPKVGATAVTELANRYVSASVQMPLSAKAAEAELLAAPDENSMSMEDRARQAAYAAHAQREAGLI